MSNKYIVSLEDIALGDMKKNARKHIAFDNHLKHYCAVTIQCYLRRWYTEKVFKKMIVTARNTTTLEVEALQMDVIEAIPIPELNEDDQDDDSERNSDSEGSSDSESSSDSDDNNNEEDDYRDPTSRVHANNILDEYDSDDLSYLRTKLRHLNLLQRTGVIDKLMMKKRQEELLRRHNF